MLPDDVILAEVPALLQMRRVFEDTGRPVVALMEVSEEETSRYGIVAGELVSDRRFRVTDMVEKPKIESAVALRDHRPLHPAAGHLPAAGEDRAGRGRRDPAHRRDARARPRRAISTATSSKGTRYDAGEKLGYLKATVDYALRHPKLGREFRDVPQRRVS